jgi:hypothetical protein
MNFLTMTLAVIMVIAVFTGCATIVSKSRWPVSINTNPIRATVEVTDKKGVVVYKGITPAIMFLKSGAGYFVKQSYTVKLKMEGYEDRIIPVECTLNGWYFGNIIIGGLIGLLIVDPLTGAMYRLDKEFIYEIFSKSSASTEPSLRIIHIKDLPENMEGHLVCIK